MPLIMSLNSEVGAAYTIAALLLQLMGGLLELNGGDPVPHRFLFRIHHIRHVLPRLNYGCKAGAASRLMCLPGY